MHVLATSLPVLARAVDTAADPNAFWGTSGGLLIKGLLAAFGILAVIVGGLKSFKHITAGKTPEAAKIIFGVIVLAVFCFRPELITSLVQLIGNVVEGLFNSGDEIIKNTPTPAG